MVLYGISSTFETELHGNFASQSKPSHCNSENGKDMKTNMAWPSRFLSVFFICQYKKITPNYPYQFKQIHVIHGALQQLAASTVSLHIKSSSVEPPTVPCSKSPRKPAVRLSIRDVCYQSHLRTAHPNNIALCTACAPLHRSWRIGPCFLFIHHPSTPERKARSILFSHRQLGRNRRGSIHDLSLLLSL